MRGIVREFRSLRGRIQIRCDTDSADYLVALGPAFQYGQAGRLELCARTQARSRDTRSFLASYPWASGVDLRLFLEGWDRGEEWVRVHNQDTKRDNTP